MANVRYLVHDVDAALAFYTGPPGFELNERWRKPVAGLTQANWHRHAPTSRGLAGGAWYSSPGETEA